MAVLVRSARPGRGRALGSFSGYFADAVMILGHAAGVILALA